MTTDTLRTVAEGLNTITDNAAEWPASSTASHAQQLRMLVDQSIAERDRLREVNAELLAALKSMMEPHEKAWRVTDWTLRLADARDAIAKAEGQS